MTANEFCIWLEGYLDGCEGYELNKDIIQDKMKLITRPLNVIPPLSMYDKMLPYRVTSHG